MCKRFQLLVGLILLSLATPVLAQRITSGIRGTVTDTTGAVVPGANVTLKSEGTGFTRSAVTNTSGRYAFSELPIGSYRIEVGLTGFKSAAVSNIATSVAVDREVNVTLAQGELTEVVTVEASANAVQTLGGDVSGLVTGETARELPLNGRNFMQLALLMPGVTVNEGLNTRAKGIEGGSDVSVSGGGTTANLWMVDGANNNDVGSNRTILVYPSVDAIEEFKIQRNNYGAEFGQAGGAQVNLITRAGTNEFHGSLYYFARRDRFNSKDFFLEQAGQDKAPLKWDDFGATFGGPLIKDKLHFFISEEWNKDKRSSVRSAFVPTEAERRGDFSGARIPDCSAPIPNDPLTGQPFPGNRIPENRISPAGRALMGLYSLPNTTPVGSCNNFVSAVAAPVNWRQDNVRLDWSATESTRLMLRYTQDTWDAQNTNLWGDDASPVVASDWSQPGKSFVAQLTQNIGSRSVNSLTFSYSANKIEVTRGGENPSIVEEINRVLPTFFPADGKQQGGAAQPLFWGGGGYHELWNQAPWLNNQDLFVLKDDYSAVFGKHFIKVGALASYNKKNEEPANTSEEGVSFGGASGFLGPNGFQSGVTTGNILADFMLRGSVFDTGELQTNDPVLQRWADFEFYLNDSIKASSRLTVDVGVRFSHLRMPWEANDQMASFSPDAINPALGNDPCNGLLFPPGTNPCQEAGLRGGTEGPNRQLQPQKFLLVAPRLGFAWDVKGNGKTALRGGVGLFYNRERLSPGLSAGLSPPFSGGASITRTLDSATPVTGSPSVGFGAPRNGFEQKAANPYNLQWNLTFERELVRNTTLELAYVGSRGGNLTGNMNINQVAPQDRLQYARTNDATLRPYDNIAGLGNANIPLWQHNRKSIYHGLQTQLVTRFGRASQAQVSYTFSKAISNEPMNTADSGLSQTLTLTDNTNPDLDRGRGLVDRTHVFNSSFVLATPLLEDKSAAVRHILGDWEFTGIVAASTGYPLTVYTGSVPGLPGGSTGTGHNDTARPNIVDGQPCQAGGSGSETQWLNPAAWTLNGFQIGSNGNSGRAVCEGPGFFQVDTAIYKNIRVSKRIRLQVRAEIFNVFNRVNFLGNSVNTTYAPGDVVFDAPTGATASRIVSANPTGGFGQLRQAADARQMQFGVRLIF